MKTTRIEYDGLGAVAVPTGALYGAQTQRAIENFPTNGQPTIGHFPELIEGLLLVKQAAAQTNQAIGGITDQQAQAIQTACHNLIDGELFDQFPVHYLHGGGGTSANMNVNEVISNIGEEILGGTRGDYKHLHPNDQVNLNQSTNDVYPTACHLAVLLKWRKLQPQFKALSQKLDQKIEAFGSQERLARTCLQDAVDITFGDFLSGYSTVIKRCASRLDEAVLQLASVGLGGTIVGRSTDVPADYLETIVETLSQIFPGYQLTQSNDLFDAAQNLDDLVAVSAQLDLTARALIKIAKDIRFLVSGPEMGLQELQIPAVQPGSSIMPGKVNPVIPEFLIQICFRVIGNHHMCALAVDHGELDLNVWESPVVFGILESMSLLDDALHTFTKNCIAGMQVPQAINSTKANSTIALLIDLVKVHGYSKISHLCKEADGDYGKIRELITEQGLDSKKSDE